ncbi:MAG: polyphosphate kinase 2 family protein [Gemmatimonadota bacterium]|nr:polyphosphate kinase 2 family protein [Gemmatimonadota bacterium]
MQLHPVDSHTKLKLGDADAKASKKTPKDDELDEGIAVAVERLGDLQKKFYADSSRALLVVLQGRDASGKDGTVRQVFEAVNPQGCTVTSFKKPTDIEMRHDYLWRVHQAVPPRGMIGVFNRSHYEEVLVSRVHGLVPKKVWSKRYEQINDFERMLFENDVVILKFFLHISREEQKHRLIDRLTDAKKNWKFQASDLDDRALWNDYTRAYRDMLRECSTDCAPWYIVPANDKKVRNYFIARCIVKTLEAIDPHYPAADPKVLKYASKIV